ncbi:MAG: NfeD family protein [Pirellulaceae bacterium]|nr:NfeD family protein [Pirellulaceae bacterium]
MPILDDDVTARCDFCVQRSPWLLLERTFALTDFIGCLTLFLVCAVGRDVLHAHAETPVIQDEIAVPQRLPDEVEGHLLWVPLPLAEIDDRRLRLQFQQILDISDGKSRPVIVLRFVGKPDAAAASDPAIGGLLGRGTEFERSLSLARWLVGPVGVRARSVAYLSESIEGHAALIALACEDIAMDPLADFGRAAIDEAMVDQVVIDGYLGIAQRRGAFPPDAVRSMLDRDATLHKVELVGNQTRFVSQTALEPLRQEGKVVSETQLSIPGQLGKYTGQEMRAWRWITHVARDEEQLQEILGVSRWKSNRKLTHDNPLKPALIEIRGVVSHSSVNRWLRTMNEACDVEKANLLILHIHSPGGNLAESIRMAEFLANFDESEIETVAWVDGEALGDAALIAMACDSLVLKPGSRLGGAGEATISPAMIRDEHSAWKVLAQRTNRSEGELYGLLCPELDIHEFTNPRGRIEIGDAELFQQRADFQDWQKGQKLSLASGITAEEAVRRNWASSVSPSLLTVANQWGIERLPEAKRVTSLERWIRSLADLDWLATVLLTLAMVLFTNELTTPGLGVAGFCSFLCISLFFWMKFLDGTVEWLEIILCMGGLMAIAVEMFILPGFGIFGIGGFLMLASGIILASQTFIVPSNDYQWGKLAVSIGQIAIACVGFITTVYLLRNQLEKMPFVRMLKLKPPPAEANLDSSDNLAYLVGQIGKTVSRCAPLGKAMIGDDYWNVQSHDDLLEPDTLIEVIEVRERAIYVRRVPGEAAIG